MSMPALLSHFGIQNTRYVTTTGEIVFDGVTHNISGFTHAVHGPVTPVARHTFHGGHGTQDDDSSGDNWWDDERQLNHHVVAMAQAFPGFRLAPATDTVPPAFIGEIDTGRGRFLVSIMMRNDMGLPRVSVLSTRQLGRSRRGRWMPSPHLFVNGDLCVAAREDWDPHLHTAATVTAWAAHWLASFTEWRIIGRWPVEGAHPVAS